VASWRDTSRIPQFFFIDGRSVFPMVIFLLHIRLWTFLLALFFTAFFSILQYFGFTLGVFSRWFRNLLVGDRKIANPWWYQ